MPEKTHSSQLTDVTALLGRHFPQVAENPFAKAGRVENRKDSPSPSICFFSDMRHTRYRGCGIYSQEEARKMSQRTHSLRAANHGGKFTLIEMLVVVACIAILLCMLLPAMKSVKETTIAVVCLNQQKQTSLDMIMICALVQEMHQADGGDFARRQLAGLRRQLPLWFAWGWRERQLGQPRRHPPQTHQYLLRCVARRELTSREKASLPLAVDDGPEPSSWKRLISSESVFQYIP